ncbi:hypothetical protein T265_00210 [Opisthorchis viverrini]|uniref:Uncharacterized protein n=1 Tax=Opisthorchis viverrini TaxID=6198 RepID=A0A075A3S5_OPIVI|nr:hypothetical protein T265_00210 [Opisthorchis viverrini]KER34021.1 hypothetical protein T265_00210 [Opisthorchis viverrini]
MNALYKKGWLFRKKRKRSAVASFRCLAAMPPEGSTRARILPGSPSLDRESRVAEVAFEPRTFRSVNSRSNHLGHLAPELISSAYSMAMAGFEPRTSDMRGERVTTTPSTHVERI